MMPSGQGAPILQSHLPFTPWDDPALSRMPGITPVEGGSWIVVDDAYGAQMAERRRLMAACRDDVCRILPRAEPAFDELLDHVLETLPGEFLRSGGSGPRDPRHSLRCPDGRDVDLKDDAFLVLGRILQEDLLILQPEGQEHVLTGGLLCFPASWTLAEKIGRPLRRIHAPVRAYDAALAGRVQRLFDRVPSGRAMWRANALGYVSPELHQPRTEAAPKAEVEAARYLRCERQTVLRLPRTQAIVFAVHTYVVEPGSLTPAQRATCPIAFAR